MAENVTYSLSLNDNGFSSTIGRAERSTQQLDITARQADRSIDNLGNEMRNTGSSASTLGAGAQSASSGLGGMIKRLGLAAAGIMALKKGFDLAKASFNLGAEMEQTEIAFGTFLRSAEKGKKVIADLNEFANVTPYDNDEIIKSGRVLLAANIPAEKLTDTLRNIGDVAAGANVPITDLANIYSKSMNKGKLQAEELNQLAERGIPIIDMLAKKFGVTKQEVFKMGSKGQITSDVMVSSFQDMTKEGGLFFNLMKKQSESATGLLSTLGGKVKGVGTELGKRMLPNVKSTTKGLISLTDTINDIVKVRFSDELRNTSYELNAEFNILKKGNITAEERAGLIADINSKYGKYLPQLLTEKSSLEDIRAAQKAANSEILKRIEIEAKREIIEEAVAKASRKRQKLINAEMNMEMALIKYRDLKERQESGEELTFMQKNELNVAIKRYGLLSLRLKSIKKNSEEAASEAEFLQKKLNIGSLDEAFSKSGAAQEVEKNVSVSAVPSKELQQKITSIESAAPKTFNINVGSIGENFTINTQNITEAQSQVRDSFFQMWERMLLDIQAVS